MIRTIWTFPGQLTEYVGMTRRGWLARSSYLEANLATASDIVQRDLGRICKEGPEHVLHQDENAAVAVLVIGVSAAQELMRAGRRPDGLLGYSLGLYSAAVMADAISLRDGIRLADTIAREGTRVFASKDMAMGFITGVRLATLESVLAEDLADGPAGAQGRIAITNINSQAQLVIAGGGNAVDLALERVRTQSIRCERLPISHPYHSRWMAPVASHVAAMCRAMEVRAPRLPFFDHLDGSRLETAEQVRARLSEHLVTRLDWRTSVHRLIESGAGTFVEMPPGATTTRMVRWIAREAICLAMDRDEDHLQYMDGVQMQGRAS